MQIVGMVLWKEVYNRGPEEKRNAYGLDHLGFRKEISGGYTGQEEKATFIDSVN